MAANLSFESKEFKNILDVENRYYELLNSKYKLIIPVEDQPTKVCITDVDEYENIDNLCRDEFAKFSSQLAIYANNPDNPNLRQIAKYFNDREMTDNSKKTTILAKTPCVISPIVDYRMRGKTNCPYELWIVLARNDKERNYMVKRDTEYDWDSPYDVCVNFIRLLETGMPVLIGEKTSDAEKDIQQQLDKMGEKMELFRKNNKM